MRSGKPYVLAREASPRSPTTQGDSLRGTEQGDQGYGRDGPGVSVTLLGGRKHDTPVGVVETNRVYLLGVYPCPVLAVTPTLLVESSDPPWRASYALQTLPFGGATFCQTCMCAVMSEVQLSWPAYVESQLCEEPTEMLSICAPPTLEATHTLGIWLNFHTPPSRTVPATLRQKGDRNYRVCLVVYAGQEQKARIGEWNCTFRRRASVRTPPAFVPPPHQSVSSLLRL